MDSHGLPNRGLIFKNEDGRLSLLTLTFTDKSGNEVKNPEKDQDLRVEISEVVISDFDDLHDDLKVTKAEVVEFDYNEVIKSYRLASICTLTFSRSDQDKDVPAYEAARNTAEADPIEFIKLVNGATRSSLDGKPLDSETPETLGRVHHSAPRRFGWS